VPDYSRNVFCLLGLPFDAVDITQAAGEIRASMDGNKRCFLSTPNLNFLIACRKDPVFRASVVNSNLVVADGMPIVWLARLLGIPIQQRVAGSDLFEVLRKPSNGRKIKVFFFGGQDGIAQMAARTINSESLGMYCVGHLSPGFGTIESMSTAETLQEINSSNADFLVVSLGARKGQEWITHNLQALSAPVISHLGAVVNFVAGNVQRAPRAFQAIGLEWLWRIKEEPQLWRRYLDDGLGLLSLMARNVLPLLVSQLVGKLANNTSVPAAIQIHHHADHIQLVLEGHWDVNSLQPLREALTHIASAECKDLCIDMHAATGIDSSFAGLLLLAHGYHMKTGHSLKIENASRKIVRQLRWMGAAALCNGD
jgi:N-acetylglucosaminyldiphosphoundecaprenol N-acetyl-beta-D-mannosaminyltransferase